MRSIHVLTMTWLSATLLYACSSSSGTSGVPSGAPSLNPSWVNLYAANADNSTVTVYKPGSNEPERTITQGFHEPTAIAFDREGDLYVLNSYGWVSVYAPGANSVLRTVTKGIGGPSAMALDAAGNLYVSNWKAICNGAVCSYSYSVLVYAAGSISLTRTISQGILSPFALAFDRVGNLYVSNGGIPYKKRGTVTVYAPGSSSILRTITKGLAYYPGALAFDPAGNLYVAQCGSQCGVTVYAAGSDSVLRSIPTGGAGPVALAFDRAGNLYVALSAGAHFCVPVIVYASGTTSVLRTISQGLCQPQTLAFDNAGNLYVANFTPSGVSSAVSNVLVYSPGSTSVLRTITKGIHNPRQLAFGP